MTSKQPVYVLIAALALAWCWLQLCASYTAAGWEDEVTTQYRVAGFGKEWPWARGDLTVSQIQARAEMVGTAAGVYAQLSQSGIHPPLYYMARVGLGPIVGNQIFGARLFSVLCAALSVFIFWRFALLLKLPRLTRTLNGAIAAASVYAFASIPFAMAHDGRYYSFTFLLIVTLLYLALRIWQAKQPSWFDYACAGMACGALACTQYLAAPLGGTIMLGLVLLAYNRASNAFVATKYVALLLVAFLPFALAGAFTLLSQLEAGGRPDQLSGFDGVLMQSARAVQSFAKILIAEPMGLWQGRVQSVLVLFLLLGSVWALRQKEHQRTFLWLAALIVAQVLGLVIFGFALDKRLAQSVRYNSLLSPLLAPLLVLGLYGWSQLLRRSWIYAALLAMITSLQVARAFIGNSVDGWPLKSPVLESGAGSVLVYLGNLKHLERVYVDDTGWNNFPTAEAVSQMADAGVDPLIIPVAQAPANTTYLLLVQIQHKSGLAVPHCRTVARDASVALLQCNDRLAQG